MKTRTKILIAIGLGVLYFLFENYAFAAPSTNLLQQAYKDFNEQYFMNQLPKDTIVVYGDLTAQHHIGLSWQDGEGRYHIVVDRATNPTENTAFITLFHESCHIKDDIREDDKKTDFDAHGSSFQNCMVNLAQRGAFSTLW